MDRLAESIGGNAAAERLGVPQSTVTKRVRRIRAGPLQDSSGEAVSVKRPPWELEPEISRLRKELAGTTVGLEIAEEGGVFREGIAMKYVWNKANRDLCTVTRMCRVV